MKRESHAGVELDRCVACGALWFDKDEMDAYRRAVEYRHGLLPPAETSPVELREGTRRCPRCADLTESRMRYLVDADYCPICEGFLLEAPALRALVERLPAGFSRETEELLHVFGFGNWWTLLRTLEKRLWR